MAPTAKPINFRVASLTASFDPVKHVSQIARIKADARFFGKTLGKKGNFVYVETDKGVYRFQLTHVKDIRRLHKELDMLTISRDAPFVMYGAIATEMALNASQEHRRVSTKEIEDLAQNKASLKEIVDTLGGIGTREWRG